MQNLVILLAVIASIVFVGILLWHTIANSSKDKFKPKLPRKNMWIVLLIIGATNLYAQGRVDFVTSITPSKKLGWSGVPKLLIRAIADVNQTTSQDTDLLILENKLSAYPCFFQKHPLYADNKEWEECLREAGIQLPKSVMIQWEKLRVYEYKRQRRTTKMRW